MQYGFSTGERVDAAVQGRRTADPRRLEVPARQLPAPRRGRRPTKSARLAREGVRARLRIARRCDRREVRGARRGLVRVRVHVRPGRGGVLRARLRPDGSILEYAHERRVFPMSPSTFDGVPPGDRVRAARQEIEQHAHEVMAYVAELYDRDFDRFVEDFEVGRQASRQRAVEVRQSAEKRLDRFAGKLERGDGEEADVDEIEGRSSTNRRTRSKLRTRRRVISRRRARRPSGAAARARAVARRERLRAVRPDVRHLLHRLLVPVERAADRLPAGGAAATTRSSCPSSRSSARAPSRRSSASSRTRSTRASSTRCSCSRASPPTSGCAARSPPTTTGIPASSATAAPR